jgi:hypothetical protein
MSENNEKLGEDPKELLSAKVVLEQEKSKKLPFVTTANEFAVHGLQF